MRTRTRAVRQNEYLRGVEAERLRKKVSMRLREDGFEYNSSTFSALADCVVYRTLNPDPVTLSQCYSVVAEVWNTSPSSIKTSVFLLFAKLNDERVSSGLPKYTPSVYVRKLSDEFLLSEAKQEVLV